MDHKISLEIPVNPVLNVSLRLFLSGLGSILLFDVDELEDLKLVITEMMVMAVKDEMEVIKFRFRLTDDFIEIGANVVRDKKDDMSIKIMEALSSSVKVEKNKLTVRFNTNKD